MGNKHRKKVAEEAIVYFKKKHQRYLNFISDCPAIALLYPPFLFALIRYNSIYLPLMLKWHFRKWINS